MYNHDAHSLTIQKSLFRLHKPRTSEPTRDHANRCSNGIAIVHTRSKALKMDEKAVVECRLSDGAIRLRSSIRELIFFQNAMLADGSTCADYIECVPVEAPTPIHGTGD